ncbi:tyrosine-type recombinase/integrase [Vibrio sonorensis]|uniref:tyrosine-type recombinase/integrase n=1 Tax=Vibrio sonorensis TaxID=1004316 RepID=UPI0008D99426|nr:site-specific integrase [Vibrio sonorensis]
MQTLSSYIKKIKPILESQLAYTSWRSECSRLNIIERELGHYPINEISNSEILIWVNEPKKARSKLAPKKPWKPKTRNAYLSLLSKIFEHAKKDFVISKSPLESVVRYPNGDSEAHPFTQREIQLISQYDETCSVARSLFSFGVLTGLRMSELIALAWSDIDFDKKILYVKRAKPLAKEYKRPKTRSAERQVELSDEAIRILRETQKQTGDLKIHTINVKQRDNFSTRRERVRFVFINSATQKPFIDPKQYAKKYFTPMLRALEIEHRGPNQIRHTFASQAITMGLPKEWVRRQLGHVNDTMLDQHYSKWIVEDAGDSCERFSKAMRSSLTSEQEAKVDKAVEVTIEPVKPSVIAWILKMLRKPSLRKHTQ